jgi:hypothetical protein
MGKEVQARDEIEGKINNDMQIIGNEYTNMRQ